MADVLDDENELVIDLAPDDGLELDPDAQLEDAFGDEFDLNFDDALPTEVYNPKPYGRSWAWDFSTGRFMKFGNSPAETHDLNTLRTWIQKAMMTAKFAHSIYDENYGMDIDPNEPIGFSDSGKQDEWANEVREALMVHDRITDVGSFIFGEIDDEGGLDVSFTIVTDDDEEITIEGITVG